MAGGAILWGQSQELSFGHVRLEMPGLRSKWRETLGSGWICEFGVQGKAPSMHGKAPSMESCENG